MSIPIPTEPNPNPNPNPNANPSQAEAAGVRRRDLLWRDFSRLCWRIVAPLRNGEPVVVRV